MAMVSGPSRPTNMVAVIQRRPITVSLSVSPVDSPTVPKAEICSNRTSWKPTPGRPVSVYNSNSTPNRFQRIDRRINTMVRSRIGLGIRRSKMTT